MQRLLAVASPDEALRRRLDEETQALTAIVNDSRIRHHETTKEITTSEHVDYLTTACYAVMTLLVRSLAQPRRR